MERDDLIDLKKKVDEASTNVSNLEGQRDILMKQLKKDWGCSTLAAAGKKIEASKKEAKDLDAKIMEGLKQLEENYDFGD
jgi:hypothetical protein